MSNKIKKNKYYYAFIAVVLIIVIMVAILDYRFGLGIVDWSGQSTEESSSERDSYEKVSASEVGDLIIKFIDVGQGDAIFVVFPDKKTMLIDAGNNGSGTEEVLEANILVDGQKPIINYAVATHSDSDHVGSMDFIYENYEVEYSYRPYENHVDGEGYPSGFNLGYNDISSGAYKNYLNGLLNENTGWEFFTDKSSVLTYIDAGDDSISYKVDFVMPYISSLSDFSAFPDSNDMSPIIVIEFAGKRIMLTGDLEKEAEEAFVGYYTENPELLSTLDCDLLKVGHHGSATSTSQEFLDLVSPEYAVISCGVNHGTYHHPRQAVLDRLINANSRIYRTDLQGTVTLTVSPTDGKMSITTQTNHFDEYIFTCGDDLADLKQEIEDYKDNL